MLPFAPSTDYATTPATVEKAVPQYTANQIVPDEIQNKLMYWRDQFTVGYFAIGDITNELVSNINRIPGHPITQLQVWEAVGLFTDRSARTVRYYADTAGFFPKEIREEYVSVPFSIFNMARAFADWKAVLDYAAVNPGYSRERILKHFTDSSENAANPDAQPGLFDNLAPDNYDPNGETSAATTTTTAATTTGDPSELLTEMSLLIGKVRRLLGSVPLKEDTRQQAKDAVSELANVYKRIEQETLHG